MVKISPVDEYIDNHSEWSKELTQLRQLISSHGLAETIKWGAPVYGINGKNVIGLGAFKSYCGLWFFQGALLQDKDNKLINAQGGKTKALRQWRLESLKEIRKESETIKAYIREAIDNQKKGKFIAPAKNKPFELPKELKVAFENNEELSQAFEKFTISKKREFAEHISAAKQVETRERRIQKIAPMILEGVGLNDKYRK